MKHRKKKKPELLLLNDSKWIAPVLLMISLIFVYFIPRAIIYADYKIIGTLPFLVIFLIIPFLVFKTSALFNIHSNLIIVLMFGTPLIVGPTCGLFQKYREKVELEKFGIWTTSIVVDRKYSKPRRGSGKWLIKCSYQANHQSYETYYHTDSKPAHPVGKKIKIIYSSAYPKIYSLDYEWQK